MKSIVPQAVIPESLIPHVLPLIHNHPLPGHFNIQQTLDRAKSEMFWPFMHSDIVNFCQCCDCYQPAILFSASFIAESPFIIPVPEGLRWCRWSQQEQRQCQTGSAQPQEGEKQVLIISNDKNSHPQRSAVEQLARTTHPFFGNRRNFQYPPFFLSPF